MPVAGVEPAPCCQDWILSPARLPIPSHRRPNVIISYFSGFCKWFFEKSACKAKNVFGFFSEAQFEILCKSKNGAKVICHRFFEMFDADRQFGQGILAVPLHFLGSIGHSPAELLHFLGINADDLLGEGLFGRADADRIAGNALGVGLKIYAVILWRIGNAVNAAA